ncbi:uncharacterized protein LOC144628599 [Oculina patagonica]
MSLNSSFLLVLFTTVLLAKTSEAEAPPAHYANFLSFNNGSYNVSWMYNSSTDRLHFVTEVMTTGWVGFGFATQAPFGMIGYDVAVGGVRNDMYGTGYMKDYLTIGIAALELDTQQDWVLTYSKEDNGTTTLKFFRDRNTTDRENDTAVPLGAPIFLIWAYHSSLDVQPGLLPNAEHTFRGWHHVTLIPAIGPTPTPTPVCGGQLHGPNGSFSTPGFPQYYPNNVNCVWRVNLARGSTLNFIFREFITEGCCDRLEIRNGSRLIELVQGDLMHRTPFSLPRMTSYDDNTVITIAFSSDSSGNEKGFKVDYTIIPPPLVVSTPTPTMPVTTQLPFIGCGGMLNGSSGSFATPGYPLLYPNNLICIWTLRIPADSYLRLKFIVFHTEQCCDTVKLIDSAGQVIEVLSGFKPQYTVRVDGTRTDLVRVRFDSDSSVRRIGFLAQYHIIPLPPTPTVPFTTPITALPTLSSIPFPTTLATALPTLFHSFPTTLATALPTFSSAPFDTTDFTVQPSTPSLSPVMTSSVVLPVILPPDVQRVLVDLLSSVSQIVQQLTGLLGKPITPADFESFRNETLQILRQIENQLLSPTPTQPSGRQMAKRAIPDIPDLQQLVQILDNIQRRLLG